MRRFEFVQGTSAKFWMGDVEGNTFVVVYGRLGTPGQRKDKGFPTAEAAQRELDKKIAEKLREGYQEVSADGSAAPAPAASIKEAEEAPKLDLPRRFAAKEATAEALKAAADALAHLGSAKPRKSWDLGRRTRRARRALSAVAGLDPASNAALAPVFDALMARVVAAKAGERFPLVHAMELLHELDAAAFERAVTSTWSGASASPASGAISVLAKQLAELEEPELALRVGALLVDRPDHGSMSNEAGWAQRWKALSPHLSTYLTRKGGTLKGYLKGIDAAGDVYVARRVSRMLS